MAGTPLDTRITIKTPERVEFERDVCGPFTRLFAALIDGVFIVVILSLLLFVMIFLSGGQESAFGLYLAALFVIEWGYKILFEMLNRGRTPGKSAMRLRVISADGSPLRPGQAVVRNLVRALEGPVPFAYMPALASICLGRRFQRLGDLAAGTIVIREEPPFLLPPDPNRSAEIGRIQELLPARLALGGRMIKLLSEYNHRRRQLSAARLNEIANPLANRLKSDLNLPAGIPADPLLVAVHERLRPETSPSGKKARP